MFFFQLKKHCIDTKRFIKRNIYIYIYIIKKTKKLPVFGRAVSEIKLSWEEPDARFTLRFPLI